MAIRSGEIKNVGAGHANDKSHFTRWSSLNLLNLLELDHHIPIKILLDRTGYEISVDKPYFLPGTIFILMERVFSCIT